MTILTIFGARLVCSNFVFDFLAQPDVLAVKLDKLTFAGYLEHLASLQDITRHTSLQGGL